MQKKLIAAAVAGALVAPSAMAEVAVGGSVRTGVEYLGASKQWVIADQFSRLHFRASSDLGNGQSAFVNYEFRINGANGSIVTGDTQRLTIVGLKGDWGSLSLGSQWSAMFNAVGTFMDRSMRYGGGGYYKDGCAKGRIARSAQLMTTLGGLSVMGEVSMDPGGDDLDTATVGGLFGIGGVSLGAAWMDNGSMDCTGIGASLDIGGIGLAGGFVDQSGGDSGWSVNAKVAGLWLDYAENDSSDAMITGNYRIGLGGGASIGIEVTNDGDDTTGIGFMQYNF